LYARESGLDPLVSATEDYFLTEDAMREGNPQLVLERGEAVALPPTLIVQGTADANVPMAIPERFVTTYRTAGGVIELERFPDMPHGLGRFVGWSEEGKARALARMKDFVASQLAAHPLGV
jgi:acetyl esterase/lipase